MIPLFWCVVAIALGILCLWGWRNSADAVDFFAAARRAGPWLAGLGGTAAGLSAFVFVGGPGLFASIGVASLWIVLSAPLSGALQCWVVGERIVALRRDAQCVTVPELVAARFGNGWPQGLTAVAVLCGALATLAVQIKGVSLIGETLTGLSGGVVAAVAMLATVAYTSAGGMRSGLLAEALQGVFMAAVAALLAVAALAAAGGPTAAVHTVLEARPELLSTWGASGPTAGIGLFLLFAIGTCAQPHYLQKFLLVRERGSLRWMPAVMAGTLLLVLSVWVGLGLGGTALWLDGRLTITGTDHLTAAFLKTCLPAPALTLAVAAVLAAVMSTAASLLNLAAAAVTRDLPCALGREPQTSLTAPRLATVAIGVAATAVALGFDRHLAWLGIIGWGTFTAALLPVVVVGFNWSGATRLGAVTAMVSGSLVQLLLEIGRSALELGSAWEPGLTGAAVGVLVLVAVSFAQRTTGGGR